ncbi:MAG: acetyl-CoA acetyltransferase [Chloroflexota bacterium]|nr:acetyl-CoA acetyltransferase [Chloroflexota bacterium]
MAESIKDKVAIVGMGCTRFGERWDCSAGDLVVDAAYEAYADAGIEPKDIQAAWVGVTEGIAGLTLTVPLRMQYKPVTRVENMCATASDAFRNACYAVAAGVYDIVLALGVEKLKDSGFSGLGMSAGSATANIQPTTTAPGMFAMLATTYFARYGLSPDEGKKMLAYIPVRSHHNGALNPKAHFQREITMEQVLKAPIIAWPLGLFDCCGVSDGSAAAVIVRAEDAKKFRPDPVYVKALQICVGPSEGQTNTKYDYTHVEETYQAGLAAYAEAGVKDARKEISMAEVHDCFSITEATIMEDLQFSPRGRVKDDLEAGTFTLEGDLPVQPDGGLKCFGHPIGASGLRMLYEMYLQLQGKAGPRQIKNPTLGLTHNMGGQPPGCTVSCIIVGH